MREDADFSLHPRPPSPPATYIFLSFFSSLTPYNHRRTHIARLPIHPSIAHTALVFILLFKVTPGLLLRDRRPLRSLSLDAFVCEHVVIRVILKTGVSAAPLSSLFGSERRTKKWEIFLPLSGTTREPPRTLYFWGKYSRCSWMGEKSPFLVIPFHFLGRSSIILAIDSRAPATGNRWCTQILLCASSHWLLLVKNTYRSIMCPRGEKGAHIQTEKELWCVKCDIYCARAVRGSYRGKGAIIYVSRY